MSYGSIFQSWGLRLRSDDKTGLRPASVLVLTFWSCFHHWYFCSWFHFLSPNKQWQSQGWSSY